MPVEHGRENTDAIKIINVVLEERITGPILRILAVARRLRERKIETVVVMPEGERDFALELEKNGIRYYSLPLYRLRKTVNPLPNILWLLNLPFGSSLIARIARREGADIIHCNGLVQLVGAFAGHLAGAEVLWHLNDTAVPRPLLALMKPFVERFSDHIVFASRAVESHFGATRNGLPKGILYAPVDTSVFDPARTAGARERIRESLGIAADVPVVGMVGNVNYLKGVPDFVEAAGIVSVQRPEVRFVHVGARLESKARLYEETKRRIGELGLEERFILAGKRRDIHEILAAIDIFVIPSISEACPISLLEAMAMEKAIVATRVGGIPELVRDNEEAFLVPARDPEAIARKIIAYLDNPGFGEVMARKARARAVEHFDLSRCVDMHEYYYRSLLNMAGRMNKK